MLPTDIAAVLDPIVSTFNHLGIAYYICGSAASSTHGLARSSLDVDMVADLAPGHVDEFVAALRNAYYLEPKTIADAIERKSCFNLIHLALSFKVDVFCVKNRSYDRGVLVRTEKAQLDESNPAAEYNIASAEDIVLAKLEWYRLGDEVSELQWRDIIGVLKVQEKNVDLAYLTYWADQLHVADLLEKAWREATA
jgi:hypothetical protein